MKTTIQPIRSLCIRFSFRSLLLLFLCLMALNLKAESHKLNEETTKAVFKDKFYSRQNISFSFSDTTNYFIILRNNKNCQSCFSILNDYVKSVKDSLPGKYISITLTDSTTLNRKIHEAANKRLMPDLDGFYFQYKNSKSDNLFDRLEINNTPDLLIISNGEITRISYADIFEYNTMNIRYELQQEIFRLLK